MNSKIKKVETALVSILTSHNPKSLTKQIYLNDDGKIEKKAVANLKQGRVAKRDFETLLDFKDILMSLNLNQALVYGLPLFSPAKIISRDDWEADGRPDGLLFMGIGR